MDVNDDSRKLEAATLCPTAARRYCCRRSVWGGKPERWKRGARAPVAGRRTVRPAAA